MFAALTQLSAGGLAISGDPFFNSRAEQLGALSLKHATADGVPDPRVHRSGRTYQLR